MRESTVRCADRDGSGNSSSNTYTLISNHLGVSGNQIMQEFVCIILKVFALCLPIPYRKLLVHKHLLCCTVYSWYSMRLQQYEMVTLLPINTVLCAVRVSVYVSVSSLNIILIYFYSITTAAAHTLTHMYSVYRWNAMKPKKKESSLFLCALRKVTI